MSNISTVYDALVTRVSTILSNHLRIDNAYKVEENNELKLKQGWGIAIVSGTNTKRFASCQMSIARDFTIVITRKYFSLENNAANKATTEKLLLEDQFLVIKDFEKDPTLNTVSNITGYESDGGIEYVRTEKDNFLTIKTTFTVEYFEDLNA